jgi:hypothetical protein
MRKCGCPSLTARMSRSAHDNPPLKLYTSRRWLEAAEYVHLLWPTWGPSHWHDRYREVFGDFLSHGGELFELTDDPEAADYFLPPCGWQEGGSPQANRMAELASRHRKPMLVFFNSDSEEMIPFDEATIFRTSMQASTARPNELAWPAWTCDVLRTYGTGRVEPRDKTSRPTVGYCGYVDYRNVVERVQRTLRGQIAPWSKLRGEAVRTLKASADVDTRFVLRRRFGGNAGAMEREQYARNMLACDYALVARGRGNFSFRLYEAMSAGAIPVFIDTDCRLPFDDRIPYRELFVYVPVQDVHCIADYLLAFHSRHDTESLILHRQRIRTTFDEYLAPLAFHRRLSELLMSRASGLP